MTTHHRICTEHGEYPMVPRACPKCALESLATVDPDRPATEEVVPHRRSTRRSDGSGEVLHIEFPEGLQVHAGDVLTIRDGKVTIARDVRKYSVESNPSDTRDDGRVWNGSEWIPATTVPGKDDDVITHEPTTTDRGDVPVSWPDRVRGLHPPDTSDGKTMLEDPGALTPDVEKMTPRKNGPGHNGAAAALRHALAAHGIVPPWLTEWDGKIYDAARNCTRRWINLRLWAKCKVKDWLEELD